MRIHQTALARSTKDFMSFFSVNAVADATARDLKGQRQYNLLSPLSVRTITAAMSLALIAVWLLAEYLSLLFVVSSLIVPDRWL